MSIPMGKKKKKLKKRAETWEIDSSKLFVHTALISMCTLQCRTQLSHTRNICRVSVTAPNLRAGFGVIGAKRMPSRRTLRTSDDVGKDV